MNSIFLFQTTDWLLNLREIGIVVANLRIFFLLLFAIFTTITLDIFKEQSAAELSIELGVCGAELDIFGADSCIFVIAAALDTIGIE